MRPFLVGWRWVQLSTSLATWANVVPQNPQCDDRLPATIDQCQHCPANWVRERWPGLNQPGQIGISEWRRKRNCTGFCSAGS